MVIKPKEPQFKDITVVLANRPGTLAAMGEAMGKAGVNIEGLCGAAAQGPAAVHILVKDAAAARQALQEGGFEIAAEREVLVLEIDDRPGALGAVARKMARAGVNIDLAYLATHTRLVIGADDLDKAGSAL
jgi:hypothetical protein